MNFLPFCMVLDREDLTGHQKIMLFMVACESFKCGTPWECNISYRLIKEQYGIAPTSTRKTIDGLKDMGILEVLPHEGAGNKYRIVFQ